MDAEILDPLLVDMIRVTEGLRSLRANIAIVRTYLNETSYQLGRAEDILSAFVKEEHK